MTARQTLGWAGDLTTTEGLSEAELRAAVWLLRQAVEEGIRARVDGEGGASFTAILVIYRRLIDPVRGRRAAVLWDELSRACHAEAQALPPTREALARWFDDVSEVLP